MDSINWLIRWFSVLLAGLLFTLTLSSDELAIPARLIINQGLFLTLASYLLLPPASGFTTLIVNSLAGLPILSLIYLMPFADVATLVPLVRVCVVLTSLCLLLWSLEQLIDLSQSQSRRPCTLLVLTAAFITSSPIWLGPLVELQQPGESVVNGIVALSPLTHFSVAANYDYLRSEWFYQNSPLGSLRFAYPNLLSITGGYLLLTLFAQSLRWWKLIGEKTRHQAEQYSYTTQ
jgi:hypothetical protein